MTNLSINQLKEAIQLKEQIEKLEAQLNKILGGKMTTSPAPAQRGPKTMSAAARAKIAAAQKLRWAKVKSKSSAPAANASPKKKGGLTPEGRAKLAAAMKARWAARKKGAAAPNSKAK